MRHKFIVYPGNKFPFGVTISGNGIIELHFRGRTESEISRFVSRYIPGAKMIKISTLHKNKFLRKVKVSEVSALRLIQLLDDAGLELTVKQVRTFGRLYR